MVINARPTRPRMYFTNSSHLIRSSLPQQPARCAVFQGLLVFNFTIQGIYAESPRERGLSAQLEAFRMRDRQAPAETGIKVLWLFRL